MQKTDDNTISYETIEKSIELVSGVFGAYKKNLQWMDLYLNALFLDRGIEIEPSERLGFSPYGRLKSEEARISRALTTIRMIKEGKVSDPQRSLIAAYSSLEKSNATLADGVRKITDLYFDLADEYDLKN